MTRDEALYRVKGYLTDIIPVENYSEVEEIIKALKQEPCEDLISRQAAIKNAHFPVIDDAGYEVVRVDDILALPSADAIEVVRCKDCKNRNENCGMGEHRWCETINMSTRADDYCSYGERREP